MHIRIATSADVDPIGRIADATELFPSEMLPDLIAGHLADEPSEDVWTVCKEDGEVVGFCYAVPEQLTEGAWNMLAIGVRPDRQGNGVGGALVAQLHRTLRAKEARILLADTSGIPAFERTRAFYAKQGYDEEARIRDFWAAGDDKVTFRRAF